MSLKLEDDLIQIETFMLFINNNTNTTTAYLLMDKNHTKQEDHINITINNITPTIIN